jgi:hypothetical protein
MKRNPESHRSLFLQYDLPTSLLLLKQRRLRSTDLFIERPSSPDPLATDSGQAIRYRGPYKLSLSLELRTSRSLRGRIGACHGGYVSCRRISIPHRLARVKVPRCRLRESGFNLNDRHGALVLRMARTQEFGALEERIVFNVVTSV